MEYRSAGFRFTFLCIRCKQQQQDSSLKSRSAKRTFLCEISWQLHIIFIPIPSGARQQAIFSVIISDLIQQNTVVVVHQDSE